MKEVVVSVVSLNIKKCMLRITFFSHLILNGFRQVASLDPGRSRKYFLLLQNAEVCGKTHLDRKESQSY